MTPAKVDVLVVAFAYGGNGGTSSIIPELMLWNTRTIIKMKADPRIGRIQPEILSDTPITMTRNRAVKMAQQGGFDMILMLDSDNEPDGYIEADPAAKPFWDVAFNFAYERLIKGIPTVIAAPYCGPPPHPVGKKGVEDGGEVPYLFEWADDESDTPAPRHKLDILKRNEAARLKGIYPVAALPTGVCLFTTNAFDGLKRPYFDYEWNEDHSEKHSTEDVFATRNISLYWKMQKNIDVLFAACDSWALHHKPKKVGKPRVVPVEVMSQSFRDALADPISSTEVKRYVDYNYQDLPTPKHVLTHDQDQVYISEETLEKAKLDLEKELAEDGKKAVEVQKLLQYPDEEDEDTDIEQDGDEYEPGSVVVDHSSNGNGKTHLAHKMVQQRKIALIDRHLTDKELEAINSLATWVAGRREGPVEAAVIHSNTGQSAAAIYAALPEGSHLYCLDNLQLHKDKQLIMESFSKSFKPELETGQVMMDVEDRFIKIPENPQGLDIVFFEDGVDIQGWDKHVSRNGILAGIHHAESAKSQAEAMNAAFRMDEKTGIWAIAKGVEVQA